MDIGSRYRKLKGDILRLLIDEDAFGLKQRSNMAFNQRFRFLSNADKVEEFQKWLESQIQLRLLSQEVQAVRDRYWEQYIAEGYRKGAGRAFEQINPAALQGNLDFYQGSKEQFLRSAFGQPETIEKVKLLASRTFLDLKNANESMAAQLRRVLTDGLVQGQNPYTIARDLNNAVDSIGKRRAIVIARTEIIRAHAEGQLDAFERMGVEEVGVAVEWSTAGDDRVCPLCAPLEGIVMTLKEARGTIPRHPQCRCAYLPAGVGEDPKGQKRSAGDIRRAIDKSLKAEIPLDRRTGKPRRSISTQKKISKWAGAGKSVAQNRPKPII